MTFRLPPYPYDRLAAWPRWPRRQPGGMVDCSVGTPCDPPPRPSSTRLASSGTERGYPASAGSPRCARRPPTGCAGASALDAVPASSVAACVGTKEFVASVPAPAPAARARSGTPCCTRRCPTRPTPWAPSWPVAGPSPVPAPPGPTRRARPRRHRPRRRRRGPVAVVELAVEPDRGPRRPRGGGGVGTGARRSRVLRRVLRRVHLGRPAALGAPARHRRRGRGALALQALEPGRRAGRVLRRRRRAGRVPAGRAPARRPHGPGPGAGGRRGRPRPTTTHVEAAAGPLPRAPGLPGRRARRLRLPGAAPRGWLLPLGAGARGPLARRLGAGRGAGHRRRVCWSAPGDLYGEGGAGHVRVAVVQPMERLALVGERLARVRHG